MHAAVIGGGIVGLSSAYHLAHRGVDVTVLEKQNIGAGSTDRAAGGIRAQFSTPVSIALSKHSIAVWEDFDDRFGVDIGYRRPGYLYLAREPATADTLRASIDVHNEHDIPSRFLDPDELTEHCPELDTDHYVGATYCPTDGYADPHLALQGFYTKAMEQGAEVRIGVEVIDVVQKDDPSRRVTGVETTDGPVEADAVVNAAGGWAPRVAAMAGIDLPITPKRRQLLVVDPEMTVPDSVPFTTDLDRGLYFRPDGGGDAVVGGHFTPDDPDADPDRYRKTFDFDWATEVLTRAAEVARYFGADSEIRDGWAGIYAMTPDHHPIIDEPVPGFVNACGFSGHGFMQSPATGQLVAELVVDGRASLVDVSMLDANRFERGEALHETFYSA